MLNRVRWIGLRSLMRNVHWLNALAAATSIVSFGPSSSSEAKSTAYETDIVEPPDASGRLTFSAGPMIRWSEKTTAAALTGSPSEKVTSGRSLTVQVVGE